MRTRKLGRTGYEISEIGFGAWGLGGGELWQGVDPRDAQRTLFTAVDNGMNFIDTALAYGDGQSERLVGEVVRELRARDRVVVATKVPPANRIWPADGTIGIASVFPAAYVTRSVEHSLRNLGAEALPIAQLHVWHDAWLESSAWSDVRGTMQQLIQAGKVLHWGVSINAHDPASALAVLRDPLIETVQLIYNIYDRSAEAELFALAAERELGVIVRVPFDEGALTGTLTAQARFAPGDFRGRYFAGERLTEAVARAQALEAVRARHPDEAKNLAELALRFCLAHPAVDTVIPGMRRIEHLRANLAAADGCALSPELMEQLREHAWDKNWYV